MMHIPVQLIEEQMTQEHVIQTITSWNQVLVNSL